MGIPAILSVSVKTEGKKAACDGRLFYFLRLGVFGPIWVVE
jgi:hypothetical protein